MECVGGRVSGPLYANLPTHDTSCLEHALYFTFTHGPNAACMHSVIVCSNVGGWAGFAVGESSDCGTRVLRADVESAVLGARSTSGLGSCRSAYDSARAGAPSSRYLIKMVALKVTDEVVCQDVDVVEQ